MKKLIWKIRFTLYMMKRISGFSPKDWAFCWYNAGCSWDSLIETGWRDFDPIDAVDEEISYW